MEISLVCPVSCVLLPQHHHPPPLRLHSKWRTRIVSNFMAAAWVCVGICECCVVSRFVSYLLLFHWRRVDDRFCPSVRPSVRRCVVSFSFRWSHFYSFIVTVRVRQRVCVYILTSTREPCRRSSMVLIPLPSPLPFPFPFPYRLPTSISPATAGHSVSQLTWLNNRRMSLRFPRRSCSSIFVFLLNI